MRFRDVETPEINRHRRCLEEDWSLLISNFRAYNLRISNSWSCNKVNWNWENLCQNYYCRKNLAFWFYTQLLQTIFIFVNGEARRNKYIFSILSETISKLFSSNWRGVPGGSSSNEVNIREGKVCNNRQI